MDTLETMWAGVNPPTDVPDRVTQTSLLCPILERAEEFDRDQRFRLRKSLRGGG